MIMIMKRKTIVADENQLLEIEQIAREQKRSSSEVIREAIGQYIQAKRKARGKLGFIGRSRSGRQDVSARAEELIEQGLKK